MTFIGIDHQTACQRTSRRQRRVVLEKVSGSPVRSTCGTQRPRTKDCDFRPIDFREAYSSPTRNHPRERLKRSDRHLICSTRATINISLSNSTSSQVYRSDFLSSHVFVVLGKPSASQPRGAAARSRSCTSTSMNPNQNIRYSGILQLADSEIQETRR